MFRNMRLFPVFYISLNPSFKMATSYTNVARTAATTTREDFKSSGIGFLYEKQFLFESEFKTSLMLKFYLQNSLQNFEILFLIWYEIFIWQSKFVLIYKLTSLSTYTTATSRFTKPQKNKNIIIKGKDKKKWSCHLRSKTLR